MKNKKQFAKGNKGITLVALVVTIVVLLILAGISLNLVLGQNGIVTRAQTARSDTAQSSAAEKVQTMLGEYLIDYGVNADGNLEEFLKSQKTKNNLDEVTKNADGTFTVEKDGYEIIVNADATVGEATKTGPRPEITSIQIVDAAGKAVAEKSVDEGGTVYIKFNASIEGGAIKEIRKDTKTGAVVTLPYGVKSNGSYTFVVIGTVNGEDRTKTVTVEVKQFNSKYKIGDTVAYTYDTVSAGYSLPSTQSGYSSDQKIAQSSTALKWKILNIDESTGKIDLVGDPTDNTVRFQGALGYNNGVYLLNDICKKLYSNSAKGIEARSINLEDMEKHLTDAGFTARNAYSGSTVKYGITKTYTSNKKYPKLYASETGAGITSTSVTKPDIVKTVDPYNESSKGYTSPTKEESTEAGNNGLTVTQTYYIIPIDRANYGDAAAVLSNGNTFWVASRYVNTNSGNASFGLRGAYTDMSGHFMFGSDGDTSNYDSYRLRPVVSLDSSILAETKDASGAWELK